MTESNKMMVLDEKGIQNTGETPTESNIYVQRGFTVKFPDVPLTKKGTVHKRKWAQITAAMMAGVEEHIDIHDQRGTPDPDCDYCASVDWGDR